MKELANKLAKKEKITQDDAYRIAMSFIGIIKQEILRGQIVKLCGFFSYKLDVTPERVFSNPQNQKKIIRKRKFRLYSKISTPFKKIIDEKKAY